jgi:hypothetical protein
MASDGDCEQLMLHLGLLKLFEIPGTVIDILQVFFVTWQKHLIV